MPYQIPRPRVTRRLGAMLSVLACALAAPAAAQACTVSTAGESQAFAKIGDYSEYTMVSGSDFSAGTSGWSLTNASVTSKIASLVFNGKSNSNALSISLGGSAVSPPICVSNATPTFRFFSLGTGASTMYVNLLWNDALGLPHVSPVGMIFPNGSWQTSLPLSLGNALPLWMPGSTLSVRVQFQPIGVGSWALDEIYIDPYSRG